MDTKFGSPGKAVYGFDVKLLDDQTGEELTGPNQKGVVAIEGPLPPGCLQTRLVMAAISSKGSTCTDMRESSPLDSRREMNLCRLFIGMAACSQVHPFKLTFDVAEEFMDEVYYGAGGSGNANLEHTENCSSVFMLAQQPLLMVKRRSH